MTSVAGEESTIATSNWDPEIPFESLATAESVQIEMIVGNSLGKLEFRIIWTETCLISNYMKDLMDISKSGLFR